MAFDFAPAHAMDRTLNICETTCNRAAKVSGWLEEVRARDPCVGVGIEILAGS